MIKLTNSNPWRAYGISRVFRAVFFSAESQSSSSPQGDSLYQRLTGLGDPNISITPVLDQWVEEGRDIKHSELQKLVMRFRKYRRFSHALQMHEWMTGRLDSSLSSGGVAVRLNLISKVRGLGEAEDYFNSVPVSSRDEKVFGAMLNCYAEKKSLEKADDLFEKMMGLGFVNSALSYNAMLSLYSRMGKHEKVEALVRKMEENGIKGDAYTFNTRLSAYANSNVEEMERLLGKMEGDSQVTVDFHGYFIAANGFLKNSLSEKALKVIKKAEQQIERIGNRIHYENLIRTYAEAGRKDEVYRVWNVYKSMDRVYNSGYLSVLSALLKLDDIDGAEKILNEWESGATSFDVRIENLFITAYCKKGLVEKAFARAERVTNEGHELEAGMWQCLATQCCIDGQMAKAVETMKKAISARGAKSKLNCSTLAACLEYLKSEGEREAAHEILRLLRESGTFCDDVCDRLVDFVNCDENSGALAAMKEENNKKNVSLA